MPKITNTMIAHIAFLSKLVLSEEEKKQAKQDMEDMLKQIKKMEEQDVHEVEPFSHVHPVQNVFREDVITNADMSEQILQNAPARKEGMFRVPDTLEGTNEAD